MLAATVALLTTSKKEPLRKLNESVTFRKQDKIPYGTYVAFENLRNMFPQAAVHINGQEPGYWDSLFTYESGQVLVIISPLFLADEYEMKKIIRFVENGNDVFISARQVSDDAQKLLNCKTSTFGFSSIFRDRGVIEEDTLTVSLFTPPFLQHSVYSYPGFNFNAWAYELDTSITGKLGGDELSRVNFLHFRAGTGNLYLHLAPMAFTNYFLLHRNNIAYYEKVFSLISPSACKIGWDEYYLKKRYRFDEERKPGWFNVLLRFPALKAALLTAIFALLLYVVIEMRRKQRYIPVIAKPRNDSLDFVKTIGRLYHDKGDHTNLSRKMTSYFLEYIRTRYNLLTNKLDDDFVKSLHIKSGYPENEIREIISFISYLEGSNRVSDEQLIAYHKKLESFYQNA